MDTVQLVRVSLPATLFASLALHVGLALGIALSWMNGASAPIVPAAPATSTATMVLLQAKENPAAPLARIASAKPMKPLSAVAPIRPTAPAAVAKAFTTATESPAFALEANPNANIRPVTPDAVLCPNPAPQLNSSAAVVFILDVSGSMYEPYAGSTRIALARENVARQIRALKDGTPFAITLYALSARTSGPLVAASDATRDAAVRFVMREVDCGGGTNLPAGLAAAEQLHPGSLVLVTDGDLNSPAYALAASTRDILGPVGRCPSLAIVGIAPRESQKAGRLLQGLADQQGGTYAAAQLTGGPEVVTTAGSSAEAAAVPSGAAR